MQAVLPLGGGDAEVAIFQVEQVQRIARTDARRAIDTQRELGIEVRIGSVRVVVELAKVNQPGIRKRLFGIQSFAPAGMGGR